MKVGILALLREGKKVEYLTNGHRWDWMLHSSYEGGPKELAIKFVRSTSSSVSVMNDTTVTVYRITMDDIGIENYLFLRPPSSDEAYTTDHGSILFGPQYRQKIFVRGVFVEKRTEGQHGLFYGINLQSTEVNLDRDRKVLSSCDQTSRAIYKVWESAISSNTEAASRYLNLLLEREMSLDVIDAETLVTHNIAEILLETLKVETPGDSFYYYPQDSTSEVRFQKFVC